MYMQNPAAPLNLALSDLERSGPRSLILNPYISERSRVRAYVTTHTHVPVFIIMSYGVSKKAYSGPSLSGHPQQRPPSLIRPQIFAATTINILTSPSRQRPPL